MKRFNLVLIMICFIMLYGCSNQLEIENNAGIMIGEVNITMADDITELKDIKGSPVEYFEQESCAFEGLDRVYTYEDMIVTTFEDGNVEKIYSIELLNNQIKTKYGTSVGNELSTIKDIHADSIQNIDGTEIYEIEDKENNQLTTYYTDGTVVESIILTYMSE